MQLYYWYFKNIFSDKTCEWKTDNGECQYLVATSKSCLCVCVCCYWGEHFQVLQLAVRPRFTPWKITELVLVKTAETYLVTVAESELKIMLDSWRGAGSARCQRQSNECSPFIYCAGIKLCSTGKEAVRWNVQFLEPPGCAAALLWLCSRLMKAGHGNRVFLRADVTWGKR